jgi:hypothetical protein
MSFVAVAVGTVAVGTAVYSGVQANKSAKKQGQLQEQQGMLLQEEAMAEADRISNEGYRFKQEQMMQYIGSGVEVKGSALLVLADTTRLAEADAEATRRRGNAQMDLASGQAKVTTSQGKAALISSFGQAVSSGVSAYGGAGGSFGK